jgi:hypothetical protein
VRHAHLILGFVVAGILATGLAGAQSSDFTLTPYLWAPGFSGAVGTAGGDSGLGDKVTVDTGALSDNMGLGGGMLSFTWRLKRWTAFGDWTYAKVTSELPSKWGTLYSGVGVGLEGNVVQAFAGYDLLDAGDSHLEVFAGARYYDLKVWLDLHAAAAQARSLSGDAQWTDGVLGLRWASNISGHWDAYVQGDVGTGGSNLSWQAIAVIDYRFTWGAVIGGWRHLDIDYNNGPFTRDGALSGPLLGVSFRF